MFLEPCNCSTLAAWRGSFPRGCALVLPEKLDRNTGKADAGDEGLRCGVEVRKGRSEGGF